MFDLFKLNKFIYEYIDREYIIKFIYKYINKFICK